jgi:isochorismate hydrolase
MNSMSQSDTPHDPQSNLPTEGASVRLEVDWEGLAVAFENQLPENHSFLDLKTGKVHTIMSSAMPEPPGPAEEFRYIPPRSSREGYRTMQRFIEKIEDAVLKEKLVATLVGKGAFRRFKDVLLEYPETRQQWFGFKDAEVYNYIREWLVRERIEATNSPPQGTSKDRIPSSRPRPSEVRRLVAVPPSGTGSAEQDWKAAIAPYDRPGVAFNPARTALLVIDMQRVFVDPQGSSFLPAALQAAERLAAVLDACRQGNLPVIFTRHLHRQPREDGGALGRWWRSLILETEPESELASRFRPRPGERLMVKSRYSAFAGTELLWVLRALQIEDLLIGGVMTNLCCETTARDAFVQDFNVFFLADGTAAANQELQLASLRNVAYGFGRVLGAAEAVAMLASVPSSAPQPLTQDAAGEADA